jgi:hypothetical protein
MMMVGKYFYLSLSTKPMLASSHLYHSFLLRLWRDDETSSWRVQLEDPHTGERRGFSSMEKMVEFLDHQIEVALAERGETDQATLSSFINSDD